MSLQKKIKRKGECRQIRTASLQYTHQHALSLSHAQYTCRTSSPSRCSGAGAGERDGEPLFLGTGGFPSSTIREWKNSVEGVRVERGRRTRRMHTKTTRRTKIPTRSSCSRMSVVEERAFHAEGGGGGTTLYTAELELSNIHELGGWDGDVHTLGHIHLEGKRAEKRADAARRAGERRIEKGGDSSEHGNKERPRHLSLKPLPRIFAKWNAEWKKERFRAAEGVENHILFLSRRLPEEKEYVKKAVGPEGNRREGGSEFRAYALETNWIETRDVFLDEVVICRLRHRSDSRVRKGGGNESKVRRMCQRKLGSHIGRVYVGKARQCGANFEEMLYPG
ncbi:hypothetical protein B0H16DRAFT_1770143 [Mycena metata]|uniref:Uncharacterized protein n=1 Tax=Mycena metata TaxID=1033252 RepID=A0AAD7I2M2_9AGAR|nr:hypothetical protein B0H16DRAFT_1770143 [Mycena metata]